MSAPRLLPRRSAAAAIAGLIALVIFALLFAHHAYRVAPLHVGEGPRTVRIPVGSGPGRISEALARAGIAIAPWRLSLALRWRGDGALLKAAYYEVEAGLTLASLLDRISRGEGRLPSLTIVEGWTFERIRKAVAEQADFAGHTRELTDAALLQLLEVERPSGEGLLLPDTYLFAPGASEVLVYRRALEAMRRTLEAAWSRRSPDSALRNAYEALVLASIIQKETGRDEDRALIGGVFVNRLNRGMRLQSDPTTIYALGDRFTGRLSRADLQTVSPYNTYVVRGLPPTPIASPGRASIEAAVRPAVTRALYFVARGDGSSEFSEDLAAHQRAVNRFQRGQP
jgi:UPF0755 protein